MNHKTKDREKVKQIEYRLEDRIKHFYKTYNAIDSGMLRSHIIKDAEKYYELTGNFYRRTWKNNNRKI